MIDKLQLPLKFSIEISSQKIDKCLGLVPYYCNNSNKITSHIYIIQTLKRMNLYTDTIIVFTNNIYDREYLESIKTRYNLIFDILYIETTHPLLLPLNGLNYIVKNIDCYKQYKYILYNEADQILYINVPKVIDIIKENNILNMHRFDKMLFKSEHEIYESNGDAFISFNGKEYLLSNYRDYISYNDDYFVNNTIVGCYGASYLCTLEIFAETSFEECAYLPMEHATLCHLEQGHNMLKTKEIFDAFSIHLSNIGKIHNQLGFDIEDYPDEW
jgi:hypothetical protein